MVESTLDAAIFPGPYSFATHFSFLLCDVSQSIQSGVPGRSLTVVFNIPKGEIAEGCHLVGGFSDPNRSGNANFPMNNPAI
jgi:hypothetical protein